MKQNILLICLCVFLLTDCHTPKKIVSNTKETVTSNEKQSEATISETYNFADTTKKRDVEINYFKIEFYPPAGPDDTTNTIPDNFVLPEALLSNVNNNNIKKPPNTKGGIKSIEGYTITDKSKQSGINKSKESAQVKKQAEKSGNVRKTAEIKEQPAADPYRWRYIFGIAALTAAAVFFLLRKSGILTKIISFFLSLFKGH
jgi:hypothetical protein